MACKGIIQPEKLPPTERTAYFHGLRTHLQIMCWSLLEFQISAVDWGWKQHDGAMAPIMTNMKIAS